VLEKTDVIIIGAGAAGLLCAIEAGKRGRQAIILDHANKVGKKILMSGGGRCNFTNLSVSHKNFISHNPHFCKSALQRYKPDDFIKLVEKHQVPYHEKTRGQLFCDNKSKDIVNMLLKECAEAKVTIKLNSSINKIKKNTENTFIISTNTQQYQCETLVIATGGLSIPTMGATPFGYKIAEQFGLNVWPTRPGLVPFTLHDKDKARYTALSGVAVDCAVQCNKTEFEEALLFTHRGLSGPSMLQISSYWQPGDSLKINLLPKDQLHQELLKLKIEKPATQIKSIINKKLPKSLTTCLLASELLNQPLQHLSKQQIQDLAQQLQQWQIKPNNTEGYRTAEVTLGGVDCDELSSKTFAAKKIPGLHFIGEVLDVSGWLGGYNFQWAWASGFAAGQVV
jgi:predicted Rossmann fold flavoprotein